MPEAHVRLPSEIVLVFNEMRREDAPDPTFAGRSANSIANILITQSPAYVIAKTRIDSQPPKKIKKL